MEENEHVGANETPQAASTSHSPVAPLAVIPTVGANETPQAASTGHSPVAPLAVIPTVGANETPQAASTGHSPVAPLAVIPNNGYDYTNYTNYAVLGGVAYQYYAHVGLSSTVYPPVPMGAYGGVLNASQQYYPSPNWPVADPWQQQQWQTPSQPMYVGEFSFERPGDRKGIIYYLATNGGVQPWACPVATGRVKVWWALSCGVGHPYLGSRSRIAQPQVNAWSTPSLI